MEPAKVDQVILADDQQQFMDLLNNHSNVNAFTKKGSKKECIICKAAFLGANNCIQYALVTDMLCNHYDKNIGYFAASGDHISILILLLNFNISLEGAIFGSIKYGKYQSFIWLVENDYEQAKRDLEDQNVILLAAKSGNVQIFEYIIENHQTYLNYKDNKNVYLVFVSNTFESCG
ncbi:hypothetical protein TRFO_06278 [Tritrichomonas foetus]|uniref:DUF3447 domain-containing protein n=1 Tax=Tritrichomonas foetus TaxID=1144522 RepID=A0A1J4K0C9_9EUKA|nr:hypothetical protein TRFO_06278 [Tritrichomonas foetus]|eukprot:OHT04402.1 hypothetical protein TRFO_06278 [Tritrichomonas foetus]